MLRRSTIFGKNLQKNVGYAFIKRTVSSEPKLYEPADKETQIEAKLKPLIKLPKRPPFVKNLFEGKFDVDLLAFPEFLGERRLRLLDLNTKILKNLISENIKSTEIDQICTIPEKVLDQLRNLKLFGCIAPAQYGGLELTYTERARLYEVLSEDTSVAAALFSYETLGYKVISEYGSDQLKEKYLKKLASGKLTAAYCANEAECGSDVADMKTHALIAGDEYLITGSKTWVINADSADLFVVFANPTTAHRLKNPVNKFYAEEDEAELGVPELGIFLVDKHAPGITIHERKDTIGVRGLHMCEIDFKDTPVHKDNVIGDFKISYDIARRFLVEDRHMIGIFSLTILKNMQKDMTEFSINRNLYGDNLCNYGLTQMKLANAATNTYVIESIIYYTCGLMDMYENQDCEVENAIAKVFCSELAWQSVCEGMELLGGRSYLKNFPYERYLRDMKILSLFDVSNDVLKMFIALCGLRFISNDLSEIVYEDRNPYFHPKELFRRMVSQMKVESGSPKLTLKLYENVHPSLCTMADLLEKDVLKFSYGVNCALVRYGVQAVNDQFLLNRIANCAMLLYAMTAVLARSSRSYCIGSVNADTEMILVEQIIRDYDERFEDILIGLTEGDLIVTDTLQKKVADKVITSRGYFAEDPLKLNY